MYCTNNELKSSETNEKRQKGCCERSHVQFLPEKSLPWGGLMKNSEPCISYLKLALPRKTKRKF